MQQPISSSEQDKDTDSKKIETVIVFKTNVQEVAESAVLIQHLLKYYPQSKITWDIEDCDKVLRVEGRNITSQTIIDIVRSFSYECSLLE